MIEHDVPVPASRRRTAIRWPFASMQPGDSFVFPRKYASRCYSAIQKWRATGKGEDQIFTVRLINKTERRCWRVS